MVQVQSMLCSQRSEQVQLSHHWRCHWARPRAQSGPRLLVSKTGWSPFLAGPSPIVRANPGAEGSAGTAPGPRGSTVGSSRGPSHVPDRCPAFLWLQASPEGGAGDLRSQERPSSGMLVGVVLQKGEILGCSPYPHRGSQGTEPHCLPQTTPHPRVSNYLLSPLPAVLPGIPACIHSPVSCLLQVGTWPGKRYLARKEEPADHPDLQASGDQLNKCDSGGTVVGFLGEAPSEQNLENNGIGEARTDLCVPEMASPHPHPTMTPAAGCPAMTLVARGDAAAWPTLDGLQVGSSEPSCLCRVNVLSLAVRKLAGVKH